MRGDDKGPLGDAQRNSGALFSHGRARQASISRLRVSVSPLLSGASPVSKASIKAFSSASRYRPTSGAFFIGFTPGQASLRDGLQDSNQPPCRSKYVIISSILKCGPPMTDAELRHRLLSHFYRLRDSNGGYVPVDDMIISGTEPVSRESIGRVCRQLGEAGLIEWSGQLGQGHTIGSARIKGPVVDTVERGGLPSIHMDSPNFDASPTYSRATVIAAAHMLKALGHTGINEFLLEAGLLDGAAAGSGLQGRATSLAKYAIENPTELSPARRTIPAEIVRRAAALWQQGTIANLRPDDRSKFESAIKNDGHALAPLHEDDDVSHPAKMVGGSKASYIQPPEDAGRSSNSSAPAGARQSSRKVFIVHGHDNEAKARSCSIFGTH